jgi:23S rRNA pseudouridine2605 synthase
MTLRAESGTMRLNRFLARAGIGSRRAVEEHITSGRVTVNGQVCRELATQVNPGIDVVTLDGKNVELPRLLYFKYYKPRGVVTTMDDPQGRRSLGQVLKENGIPPGVAAAGRLDMDSEGLLILTNDGDLLNFLMHPSHEIEKVYRVLIERRPSEADLERLRTGIECEDFSGQAKRVIRMGPQPEDVENAKSGYWLEIAMVEGRKREIREMMKAIGHSVIRLVRISHGPIIVSDLQPGEIRALSDYELQALNALGSK